MRAELLQRDFWTLLRQRLDVVKDIRLEVYRALRLGGVLQLKGDLSVTSPVNPRVGLGRRVTNLLDGPGGLGCW